jgi:anti-sigma factor RsiW
MQYGSETTHDDWNAQREAISAYVDDALPPAERANFERHLATCATCQRELEEMRRVRALLRALPPPALPRSFTLPADVPVPSPTRARAAGTVIRPGAETWQRRAGRIAQRVGAIAAAAGVMLVLGSALLSHPGGFATGGAAGSSAPLLGRQSAPTANTSTPRSAAGQFGSSQQTPQGTQGALPSQNATEGVPRVTPSATPASSADTSGRTPRAVSVPGTSEEVPVLPLTGTGLIVGGAAVAVAGSVLSRRGRSQGRSRR